MTTTLLVSVVLLMMNEVPGGRVWCQPTSQHTFHHHHTSRGEEEEEEESRGAIFSSWSSLRGAMVAAATFNYTTHGKRTRLQAYQEVDQSDHLQDDFKPPRPYPGMLHLMVLHPCTGSVLVRRSFMTGELQAWWAEVVWWVWRVAPGRLLVLTVGEGPGTLGLRHARTLFSDLGSSFIHYLGYATSWTWAFVKGGRTIYEALTHGPPAGTSLGMTTQSGEERESSSNNVHAEGVFMPLQADLPKEKNVLEAARWHYCQVHGAMGGLCDEYNPDPLPVATAPAVGLQETQALAGVPVVVTAGKRHQYLYKSLKSLLAAPGAQHNNILVILGDAPQATTQLLHLLQLNFTTLPVQGQDNDKLFRYYRSVFHLLAQTFPRAPAVILLDEDVEVSPDFFSYMSQTLWLLHQDPTLYCINGHSILPNKDRGRGAQYVGRGAMQVSWGYAVSLNFVREALKVWPNSTQGQDIHTYDFWLYDKVRGERECVYPEVSRIRHYGVGVNTLPSMHEYEAWHRPLLHSPPVTLLNTAQMLHEAHEADFLRGLQAARVLEASKACDPDLSSLASRSRRPLVVYYNQEELDDVSSWFEVGQCAGLHAMSEQGSHRGAHLSFYPRQDLILENQSHHQYHPLHEEKQQLYISHHKKHHPYNTQNSTYRQYHPPHHRTETPHHTEHPPHPLHPQPHPLNRYGFNYYTPSQHQLSYTHLGESHYTRVYYVGVPFSPYSPPTSATGKGLVFDAWEMTQEQLATNRARFTAKLDILMINATRYNYHTLIADLFSSDQEQRVLYLSP